MSTSETRDSTEAYGETGSIRFKLSEYRTALYYAGVVAGIAFLGYIVDIAAGRLTESTKLAHQISGLLGGVAVILALCGLFVGLIWGALFLSNKRN